MKLNKELQNYVDYIDFYKHYVDAGIALPQSEESYISDRDEAKFFYCPPHAGLPAGVKGLLAQLEI